MLGRIRSLTGPVADPIRALRPADRERDRINIGAHYDQGNEFFALFLDPTMMYSCAIFPHSASTLEEASVEKLEQICRRAQLSAEDHVLEIGTGWGGFAVHAASLYGCRVTTTTISREQYEFATERVREAGLEDLVTVLFEHYRDLDGQFDKLVSIEMIEAVDWREYDDFFASCARLLKPNGLCTLQSITVPGQRFERSKNVQDFIKAVIFPGGCLPSVEAILSSTARATDFDLIDLDDIGLHYAETLRRWRSALLANRDKLEQLGFDDVAARVWEFYFCYCEAGFDERVISDVQLVLARPGFVASSSPEGP